MLCLVSSFQPRRLFIPYSLGFLLFYLLFLNLQGSSLVVLRRRLGGLVNLSFLQSDELTHFILC